MVVVSALAGCTGPTALNNESLPQLADTTSITQNANGTFTVVCKNGTTEIDTASQVQNGQVCVGQATNPADPFDPASCTGAALTAQQALGYVNLTKGLQDVKVGRFQVYRRWRQIYSSWPAGDWQTAGISDLFTTYNVWNGSSWSNFTADSSSNSIVKVPLAGEVHVDYDSNRPMISLYGDPATFALPSFDPTVAFSVLDWDFSSATATIPPPLYVTSQTVQTSGIGNVYNLPLTFAGHNSISFQSAVVTSTCVRFAYDGTENMTDSDNNTWVRESQLVVLGTISSN
jgi:hypothetical protein